MKFILSLLTVCAVSLNFFTPLNASKQTILGVINNSGSAILISYLKTTKGPLLKKLVEEGEVLIFGVVKEAMISGVGIIGQYMTPAPFRFFPPDHIPTSKYCIVKVRGTKNRSVTKPFGDWNISYLFNKFPEQVVPSAKIPKENMIIDAFPTVVRMGIPTPRFILGLPQDATIADAVEAETILSEKWSSSKATNPQEDRTIVSIIHILNKAREAFELNKPDEPLSELVPPRTYSLALAE